MSSGERIHARDLAGGAASSSPRPTDRRGHGAADAQRADPLTDPREGDARVAELCESRDARLAVRVALAATIEPADRAMTPRLAGLDPFTAWELVRTDAGGRFSRAAARVRQLSVDAVVERTEAAGARIVIPGDAQWPTGLDDLPNPPFCLWVSGASDVATACERSVSMVGARAATAYGTRVAAELAYDLAGRGFAVVSGAAFGIDTAAHRGTLAADGCTIAALACGIDIAYPAANASLLQDIEQTGAVVTELPPGCAPHKQRFLSRNRLIAAMTPGTIVVEAGLRSGSRSTATAAIRLHRLLAAVPGPVTSPTSAGPHQLIREGGAVLVTDAEECAELFGRFGADLAAPKRAESTVYDGLPESDRRLLDALPVVRGTTTERLAVTAGLSPREVTRALAGLHSAGLVERVESGWRRAGGPGEVT